MSAQVAQPELWAQLNESALYRRVTQYSLFSRAFDIVGKAKENSAAVKTLVDLSTNVAGRALAISQPVLVKVDQIAGLDSRGDKALALLEQRASDVYQRVLDLDQKRKEAQSVIKQAVTSPLDTTITILDKYLPGEEAQRQASKGDSNGNGHSADDVPRLLKQEDLTSSTKLSLISLKLRKGVQTGLKSAKKLSEERLAALKYANALIQYSSSYVDALHITEVGDKFMHRAEDAKAFLEERLVKFNEFVAQHEQLARIHAIVSPVLGSLKTRSQRALFVTLTALATISETTSNGARSALSKTTESLDASVKRISSGVKVFVARLDATAVHHMVELAKTARWIAETLQNERAQLSQGTWSYIQSIKVVAEIQRRIRDVLVRTAGVLPSQLLGTATVQSELVEAKSSE
eukprot:TRINITY_DN1916_c0_g1_i1.p1 TRINITY_DN1916_c0_g1~~TRINITY_DN1916_c0_g1_i1.p1  ORF type:complete len:406 (+),score=143.16 TRINITY_DN1916_c0_g1_i1:173-1390(+)